MKRILGIAVTALVLAGLVSCGADRNSILKVYNWGDYIDEELLGEFEQWYEEQTGEPVHVVYQTFDINETMLSKIEKGHEDYDVVCPSDYIIERMLREDLILPIDRDFGDTPNYIDDNVSPYIKSLFNKVNGGDKNANDYAVGYMWGTTGILYNAKYVTDEEAKTWDIIRNPKYKDKIFIKDAPRDVYGPVLAYLKQKELQEGSLSLDDIMYDSSEESIAAVEGYMKQVKELIAGWEADFGKEQMTQEKGWLNFTWSGDASWAIEEAAEVGVDLRYTVPDEGSNVWFDGWVIPKYAKNIKAAKYFINFLCRQDNAIRNMDVIGYVSVNAGDEILEAMTDDSFEPIDLRYFFGEQADSVKANPCFYPDANVIERCTMMHDWGDETPRLIEMWSRIKGDNANGTTYVVIASVVALLIVILVVHRLSRKHKSSRKHGRKH